MGMKIYFWYKTNNDCYNVQKFRRKMIDSQGFCDCTEDDYECSFGYYRVTPESECSSIDKNSKEPKTLEFMEMFVERINQSLYRNKRIQVIQ